MKDLEKRSTTKSYSDYVEMNPASPRVNNLCGPTSPAPQILAFGCGHGNCSTDGTFCICDPGYGHSNYLLNVPTCQETSQVRTGLLIYFGILSIFLFGFSSITAYLTRRTIRKCCILTAIGELFYGGVFLSLYLEGYWGPAGITLMSIHGGLILGAESIIVNALLESALIGSHNTMQQLKLYFLIAAVVFPLNSFISWIVAIPFAYDDNWTIYNKLQVIYFLGIVPAPIFFPLISSKAIRALEAAKNSQTQNEKIDKVIRNTKSLRKYLTLALLPTNIVGCFIVVTTLAYNQVPVQPLFFFLYFMISPSFVFTNVFFMFQSAAFVPKPSAISRVISHHTDSTRLPNATDSTGGLQLGTNNTSSAKVQQQDIN